MNPCLQGHQVDRAEPGAPEAADEGAGAGAAGGDLPGEGRPRDHPGRLRPPQAGDGRGPPLPDPHDLLRQPRLLPDRVHGRLHAVHQHRRPLRRGHELQVSTWMKICLLQ